MARHDWGYRSALGPCIWCGAARTSDNTDAECPKHPRSSAAARPIPPSGIDDFDFIGKRIAELAVERAAAAAKPEE